MAQKKSKQTGEKKPPPKRDTAKRPLVGSARVRKRSVANDALPDDRASDTSSESPPILSDLDLHLFGEGKHYLIYEKLGAHVMTHEGKRGVTFAVWAPA